MPGAWSGRGTPLTRRVFVLRTGALVVGVAAAAQRWPEVAGAQTQPSPLTAFTSVSSRLTAKTNLNPVFAQKALSALEAAFPNFDRGVQALLNYLNARTSTDMTTLQAELNKNRPDLAPIPPRIMTAWYLGIVGDTTQRAIAYEQVLMFPPVSPPLNVQSYCLGPTGVWSQRPA
jgi:fructose 5-dehydrogenase small subunit